jgi:hypothetical protein
MVWINMMLYSVLPEDFMEELPRAKKVLSAMWSAGYSAALENGG